MANFTAGTSFTDGVTNDVTAAKLNALVADAVPTSNLSLNSTTGTIATLNSTTGTIATLNSTTGTIATLNSTTGTIATLNSTTGTIATLNSTTGTIATLNSTTGTIATLNSTTGTIATLNSTTGTIATLNSTTGTIATLNSTTGTIPTLVATTLITTGTGTAAAPAIVPTGDTNTGIFFPAADTIAFSEGGAEAMRIDSSGNVGIGISPSQKLDVSGGVAARGTLFLGDGSSSVIRKLTASTPLTFANQGGSAEMTIDSSGNVGIGTASPSYKLDVTANTNDAIVNASGASDNIGLRVSNTQTGGGTYRILAPATGSGYSVGGLVFENQGVGPRMTIDSSGNVTIAGLAGSGSRAVNASAAGLLSAASDASLKEEVVGASIAGLNEILQIHPKMYRWKDDIANRGDGASVELGFIANDVAPIIPSAAPMGNDGLYGFYDRSITAALVKAVQELKAENDSLKSRIEALEAK